MSKVLAVARSEYLNAVRSKAFIVGIVMMPILMGGSIAMQKLLEGRVDTEERRCAVIDGTGDLFDVLRTRNGVRNEQEIFDWTEGRKGSQVRPRFALELYEPGPDEERPDVVLSKRVRDGELFAFLVIDAAALSSGPETRSSLRYHTATPTFSDLPRWLRNTLNDEIQRRRFGEAGIDQATVTRLSERVPLTTLGLVSVQEGGEIEEAKEENKMMTFAVPIGCVMLLFMLVMMSAPALLNQVLEEKMQKISEVLVSAVSPFQLMMGKLVGTVMVSMTLSVLYLGAVIYVTRHFGVAHLIPLSTYAWFLLFQTMAMFMFGSMFSAIGAACSEIRDAQSLMMPAMLMIMIPLFCFGPVLENPSSAFARGISLFPPATPMLMLLRINVPPGPPWWEVALALVLTGTFTVGCVWAAGRVFRIGVLSQGQAPSLGRLAKWVISG